MLRHGRPSWAGTVRGMELSEALTHTPLIADDLTLVRSMHTEHNNHTEALIMFMTGRVFQGRPARN